MRNLWGPIVLLAMVVGAFPARAPGQARPRALENLQRQREAIQTAVIEFSGQRHSYFAWPTFYTGRIANQDEILINRGDAEGLIRCLDGTVNPAQGCPRFTLKLATETWVYENDTVFARMQEESRLAEHIHKMRTLGVSYQNSIRDLHETLWHDRVPQAGARRYRETIENGLHVVRGDADYGTVTWWIDPERGWSPVRVTLEQYGEIVRESRSTLKQFDGVWYPETVLFFSSHYKDGKEPLETVKVHAARFNRPEHPRRFTPADIGVEVGMMVEKMNVDQPWEILTFDGTRAATDEEFFERLRAGEIQYGPTYLRLLAQHRTKRAQPPDTGQRPGAGAGAAGSFNVRATVKRIVESEWEAYTRGFIAKYKLDDDQTQRALLILQQCQDLANRYLRRHRDEFAELDAKLRAARNDPDKAKSAELREQRAKLVGPIDRIFEEVLKPRLDRLPTRAQRRAAEPSSQPSKHEP